MIHAGFYEVVVLNACATDVTKYSHIVGIFYILRTVYRDIFL